MSRATQTALAWALGYALLAGGFLALSGRLAGRPAGSVELLQCLETCKGMLFVLATAAALGCFTRQVLLRAERAAEEVVRRDRVLLSNERRIFAGLMAAAVAHDANNVLVGLLYDLDELQESPSRSRELAERMQAAARTLVSLNRRLLAAGRARGGEERRPVELVEAVHEALLGVSPHGHVRSCRCRLEAPMPLQLQASPLLIHQMVTNLVLNAAEATGGQGEVVVRVRPGEGGAVIEVDDDGPGVPVERRTGLFEALATTKPEGNGVGLFSVQACARALGGRVEVSDSPLGGARFRVVLPLEQEGERTALQARPTPIEA